MKLQDLPAGSPILVEWEDIVDYSDDDWHEAQTETPTAQVRTAGFLAAPFDGRVLRVSRDFSDEGPHGVRSVPIGCVVLIQALLPGDDLLG